MSFWPFSRARRDRELDEEIRSHLAMAIRDRIARGEDPKEAAHAARREFGNVALVQEVTREMWGWSWLERLGQDVRYAIRTLRRTPGFATAAILTLALGLGANTLVYSLAGAVLLRPLPWSEPERLVALRERPPTGGTNALSYANFQDWREQARLFEGMAAYGGGSVNLAGGDRPVHVEAGTVSASLFRVLGVEPVLGRGFTEEEDRPGGEKVVVLGYGLWRQRFGANPSVVGDRVLLDGVPFTVVGVMPPDFAFPESEQLWVPLALGPNEDRGNHWLSAVGRLKPGVTLPQAQAELEGIAGRLAAAHPETNAHWGANVDGLREGLLGEPSLRTVLALMGGAVALVLLIACANLANLLLVRGTGRRREVAVRAALGASRRRLVRQFLLESVLLSLVGGAAGLLLAGVGLHALRTALPSFIPAWIVRGLAIDVRALGFTALLSAGTGLVFGLLPTLRATRGDLQQAMRSGGAAVGVSRARGRLASALVVIQIALSLVLLSGAALLIRSLLELERVDPGFSTEQVVTASIALDGAGYEATTSRINFWRELLSRIGGLPGIEARGFVSSLPLSFNFSTSYFSAEGRAVDPATTPSAQLYRVAGDYLQAMRIPLLKGRSFTPSEPWDTAARVVLVNRTVADETWPGEDPVGQRLRLGTNPSDPSYLVVGVVGDVRHAGIARDWTKRQLYFPYAASPRSQLSLVVRTPAAPAATAAMVRRAVAAVDPSIPIFDVRTMGEIHRRSLWEPRLYNGLFTAFAAVALFLAVVGVYGIIAHAVSERVHEMGVRMAFGASPRGVVRLVLRRTLVLALAGVAIGVVASLAAMRLLGGMLYGVAPTDPLTFVLVPLALTAAALLAGSIPARRAARVDPASVLRGE